jgi:hypothetical protein
MSSYFRMIPFHVDPLFEFINREPACEALEIRDMSGATPDDPEWGRLMWNG